jgi:antitoxin MazE
MRVSKWGNSLAVRLPAALVEEMKLKEGDDVEIIARGRRRIEVSPDERRRQAIEEMRRLAVPLPPGYKFDREEANARGPYEPEDVGKTGTAAD